MKRTLLPLVLFDLLSIFATLVLIAMQFRYNVTTMKLFADTVESLSTTTHVRKSHSKLDRSQQKPSRFSSSCSLYS
jgi:hypothetical protein